MRGWRKVQTALTLGRLGLIHATSGIEGVAHAIRFLPEPLPALRRWGAEVGPRTLVYPGVTLHAARGDFSNLHIGADARVVRDCLLDLTDRITIGDRAIVSLRCSLITHRNIHRSPLAEVGYGPMHAPIVIEDGAVLFANAVVLAGVTVGACAVVAAGAVVTRDVPPWTLVGGIPARVLKRIEPSETPFSAADIRQGA